MKIEISEILQLFELFKKEHSSSSLHLEVKKSARVSAATTLEFETLTRLGSLSVWSSGCADLLVYRIVDEVEERNEHFELRGIDDLSDVLGKYLPAALGLLSRGNGTSVERPPQ